MDVIIVSPNLEPTIALGGVSAISRFIVEHNKTCNYIHFELGKRDSEHGGLRRCYHLWQALQSWKLLLKSNPNALIHYNFPLSPEAVIRDFFFMRVARKQKRKMIVHVHGGRYMSAAHIPFVLSVMLKRIFHWNVPFVVLSEHEKKVLADKFSPTIVYALPNCVETHDEIVRTNDSRILTIGYLGRITEAKGMKELLMACRELQSKGIPFKLKIAGAQDKKDSFIEDFRENLGSSFEYAGIVSGKAKREFLSSLDVFVLPSYFEGLPIALLESMNFGAVPVVTPVGSIPEVVKDGVNGLLVKEHDASSIVQAIVRLHDQTLLRHALSKAAKSTIEGQYSPAIYLERLNAIYHSV